LSRNHSPFKSVLRGIAFLFFLAILAMALLAIMISCYFFSALRHRTSIDPAQFSTSRQTMADDIPDEQITPPQVGEFVLQEIYVNVQFASNVDRHIFATYQTSDEEMVRITALLFTDSNALESLLSRGTDCGDCAGSAQVFRDADIPYGYAFCGCFGFAQHTFNWMNGRWVLSVEAASTLKSDGSTLIEFVNSYPY
jgi:hypothetical protein